MILDIIERSYYLWLMRKGDRTREAIVNQALDLATVRGLEALSIGALAAETGMSKSGLFAHFGSKEALQLAVLEAASALFSAQVIKPSHAERRGLRRLIALVENWLHWANSETLSGGCPFVAAQVEWDDREGPVRDYLVWAQQSWLGVLAAAAEKAVAQSDFRDDLNPRAFAHDVYAIALGYHNAQRLLRDPKAGSYARDAFRRLLKDAREGAPRAVASAASVATH
ncbi:MAG TPA: TetR/AcrR family transcriptional regulator [Alphaproteobacteria bacterium]|nr:TetR/AcrR family transcriptional regulator [Alphaproteobacteria bacterium]